ncbi:hypothetical protein TrispH2_009111 [Trichoplax sp. H2]|nr:hypothetical protein TrispH2_009111 [Trichoplax sp. H2]|eukprot:RDD39653.1 hypothetical protein TrispH2_009111 [Trichoplax sp. H2]
MKILIATIFSQTIGAATYLYNVILKSICYYCIRVGTLRAQL